jgi:CBS-domain-containing membrane protein
VTTAGKSEIARKGLASMRIGDIRNSVVKHMAVVGPDDSVSDLLKKVAGDPHTHCIYVVDKCNTLVGYVNLDTVLKYLFPFLGQATLVYPSLLEVLGYLGASCVSDLMSTSVPFVYDNTPVIKAAQIMIEEAQEGLPVLDSESHLLGQITLEEIVGAHLRTEDQ